jgi:hypothetical protein
MEKEIFKQTQGRWFSSGTSASSTTKAGRHDIAEILLKVALNTKKISNKKSIKSKYEYCLISCTFDVTIVFAVFTLHRDACDKMC